MPRHHFTVLGTVPERGGTRLCVDLDVIASDAAQAIRLCLKDSPTLDVTSLAKRGAVQVREVSTC